MAMDTTAEISGKPPGTDERYSTAITGQNMRIHGVNRSPGDLVAAAGMHDKETGKALERLRTEWDTQSIAKPLTREALEALSREYTVEPSGSANAGLVRQDVKDAKTGEVIGVQYVLPMALAWKHAQEWREHESKLVIQRLKSLPAVREDLLNWLDHEDGQHIVASVLLWWLSPICQMCEGRKFKVAQGTGRLSSKVCPPCNARGRIPGERPVPHGGIGKRLAEHISWLIGDAANNTRQRNS